MTPAERNLAAEVRGVESGHRAFVQPGGSIRVVSDTFPGKWYTVTFDGYATGIVFACTPHGDHCFEEDHLHLSGQPGIVSCMHSAVAARRLERDGLAVLDEQGRWQAKAVLDQLAAAAASTEPSARLLRVLR